MFSKFRHFTMENSQYLCFGIKMETNNGFILTCPAPTIAMKGLLTVAVFLFF